MILETAGERARMCCAKVRWQGATTQRPRGRKEKQHSQRALELRNRARSAVTVKATAAKAPLSNHYLQLYKPLSGQLRFRG